MYTIQGFKIATSEQARTFLLVCMLKQDTNGADAAHRILKQLEVQGR